jgi:glycosyltransferase involved in cell wall biosynthesis
MRAAIVASRAVPGGAERLLRDVAAGLPAEGVAVGVVVGEDGPLVRWLRDTGTPVVVGYDQLDHIVGAHDVVIGWADHGLLAAAPVAAAAGVPCVWWRTLTWRHRSYEDAARREDATVIVCATERGAEAQRAVTPDIPVMTISPGIAVEATRARWDEGRALRHELGWEHHPVVGMVARLDPIKGQDVLLRAAALVAERHRLLRVLIVGGDVTGAERDLAGDLAALAGELGIAERVHFVPHVEDPLPWQAALDVAVNASSHEAFGISLLEAMALGVPAVASRTDGPAELLRDGADGLLFDIGDVAGLATHLDGLLADPAAAVHWSSAAAARARDFDISVTCARTAALLRELAADPPPSAVPGRRGGAG